MFLIDFADRADDIVIGEWLIAGRCACGGSKTIEALRVALENRAADMPGVDCEIIILVFVIGEVGLNVPIVTQPIEKGRFAEQGW